MRVLLVAPDQPGINSIPEIRTITDLHRVHVLNGKVTANDLYQAARHNERDIIHFALHSSPEHLTLSEGEPLTPEDVAQVARIAGARLVFFSSCLSGRHAAYAVSHGVQYAIHTNISILDSNAFKVPLAFYEYLADQKLRNAVDIPLAFQTADPGDGTYGLYVSILTQTTIEPVLEKLEKLTRQVVRQGKIIWALAVLQVIQFILVIYLLLSRGHS